MFVPFMVSWCLFYMQKDVSLNPVGFNPTWKVLIIVSVLGTLESEIFLLFFIYLNVLFSPHPLQIQITSGFKSPRQNIIFTYPYFTVPGRL